MWRYPRTAQHPTQQATYAFQRWVRWIWVWKLLHRRRHLKARLPDSSQTRHFYVEQASLLPDRVAKNPQPKHDRLKTPTFRATQANPKRINHVPQCDHPTLPKCGSDNICQPSKTFVEAKLSWVHVAVVPQIAINIIRYPQQQLGHLTLESISKKTGDRLCYLCFCVCVGFLRDNSWPRWQDHPTTRGN